MFFKYDRKLNSLLFKAAWGALSQVLGIDDYELAAIFTVQTAGEALNHHPHLHGLLADGYWKDGVFTRFPEIDIAALNQAFAERVLAQLHKQELITDDVVAQVLSQEHTGCSVWMSQPFHDDKQVHDELSDVLPWAALVAPDVVLNKDGSFLSVIRYRGPDLDSSTENERVVISRSDSSPASSSI